MMKQLSFYYKKFRGIFVPVALILVGIILIFAVMIPAFPQVGSLKAKIENENKKLSQYKNTTEVLKGLLDDVLEQQVAVVTKALPSSKEVESIYLALIASTQKSGVTLRTFSVHPGEVFTKGKSTIKTVDAGIPNVSVNATFGNADMKGMLEFSKALLNQFPESKISSAQVNASGASMDILFYHKPLDVNFIASNIIYDLSPSQKKLLESLLQGH